MGHRLLAAIAVFMLAACEDPLVILGDRPGFMRIVAGIADSSGVVVDSLATRTRLSTPLGIAVDSAGALYIGDVRSRVFRVSPAGRLERLLNHDPCFAKTCVGRPQGLAYAASDHSVLIADDRSDKIWRLNINNHSVVAIAGTGVNGTAPDGTAATAAPLNSPSSVVVLPDGRIAFTERNAHLIRVIGTDGVLHTLAGNGTAGEAPDGAVAVTASINLPTALALGGNTLYFTETGTQTIRALDLTAGTLRRVAGNGTIGFSGDNGSALAAQFDFPGALAVSGNSLFVSDMNNHRVRLVNLQSGVVSTFAGTGSVIFNGNGRNAGEVALFRPTGLAVSPFGYLYIADSGHHIVWRTPLTIIRF